MFWTRDDSLLEEKGLLNAGNKRPQPMAKGHTVKEVKAVIPVRQTAMKSDKYNTKDQSSEKIAERKAQCKEASIKDLCKEDKKRVADLINELARLGEERESALRSLQDERRVYDEQVRVLQQQQHQAICHRDYIQQELWECQLLLAQYQQQIVKELNKKDCTSQELKAKEESSAQKKCRRSQKPRMKDTDVSTKHHRDRTPTRDTYSEPVDELRYKHKDDQHSNYSTEIKTVDKRCGAEVEYYSTGSIQSDDRTSHNAKPKHKTSIQQHKAPNSTRRVHIPTSPLSRQFTQKLDHLIHKHNGTDNQDSSIAEKENEDPIISRQMLGLNQVDKRRIRCLNSDTDTVITETDAPSVATTPGARYDKPDIRSTKRSSDTAAPLIAEFLSSTQKSDTSTIPLLPPTLPLSRHASTIHSEDFHPLIPDAISASRSTVATAECEASPRDIDHTPQLLIDIPNVEPTVSRATTASRRETSYNSNMQCNGNADSRGTRVCDTECVAGDNTHVSHDAAYHHGTDTTTHITHTHHAKREARIATYGDAAVSSATVNHVPVSTAISSVAGNTAVNDPTSRADTVTSTTKTVGFSSLVEAQDVNLTHNVDESNTEEQRLKLQAQRRALLEEQERLKTILAEQENLLLIKQHQLQQQHLEQQHRLQEFHRTGTFPDDFIPCGPTSTTQQYNDLCVTALPAQLPANRGEQMYNYAPVYTSGGALVNADNYARSSEYDSRRDGVDRQHHPQPQPLRTTFVNYSQPQYQAGCRTTQQFGSNVPNQYNCGITVDKLHAGDAHCKSVEKQIPDTLVEPVPSEHVTVLQQTQVNGQLAADDQHLQQASLQSFQSRAGMLRHKQMPDASKTSSLEKSPARRLKKSEGARTTQHTERYSFTKRDDKAELINAVELLNPVSTQSDSRDTSYMTDHDIEESRILGDVFFIS